MLHIKMVCTKIKKKTTATRLGQRATADEVTGSSSGTPVAVFGAREVWLTGRRRTSWDHGKQLGGGTCLRPAPVSALGRVLGSCFLFLVRPPGDTARV